MDEKVCISSHPHNRQAGTGVTIRGRTRDRVSPLSALPARTTIKVLMRRLARFSRPLNALFALWFALVLGDPGVLHACPMHGGHGGSHATVAATTSATASSHDAHASHDASGVAAAAEQSQHPDAPPACTCVGHCCAASVVAPVPTVAAVHVPTAAAESRHVSARPSCDVPASPDRLLPFANGPPNA